MFKPLSVLVISALVLTSCGTVRESRLNPFNWFGRSTSEPVQTTTSAAARNPLIPASGGRGLRGLIGIGQEDEVYAAPPIAEVSELLIERRIGGAIIRATGVADRVGPFDVRLIPDEAASTGGTLSYTLRAKQQPGPRSTGELARMVTVAVWLSDQDLAGIREIRVAGRTNALVSRR
ncbi:hypothetical protein ACOXXX_02085 [Thalassococcus sp. BH17M4-6]|uniref:hypothetical protein n=1 Tax=Thalassococcus sp. BH17M4-6 TaxID=3413148 RepID=UPI003BCC3CF0